MLDAAGHIAFNHGFHRHGVGGERHVSGSVAVALSCCSTGAGPVEARRSDSRISSDRQKPVTATESGGLDDSETRSPAVLLAACCLAMITIGLATNVPALCLTAIADDLGLDDARSGRSTRTNVDSPIA